MENMNSLKQTVILSRLEMESVIDIGNKRYHIQRYFAGKRGITEAINKVIVNRAVRETNK